MAAGLAVLEQSCGTAHTIDPFAVRLESSAGKLSKCLSRFLDYPPGAGKLGFPRCLWENPFSPNPDFWLKGIDFTCASPWNDSHGSQCAGTAISKRHIIFAQHFPLAKGTRIAFVGETGEVSHYTLKAIKAVDKSDIMIGLLDYELTPDVHPARILPAGYEKWLTDGSVWPMVTFNQFEKAHLSELSWWWSSSSKSMHFTNRRCRHAAWQKFSGEMIGGDSGNPAFMLYKGNPILIYCLLSGGVGYGSPVHLYRSQVQKAMDELCPGYKLEEFDFASP